MITPSPSLRCRLCPGVHKCLVPDGRGDVLFVGEAPGKQEEQKGRVFIGKTGDEVNRHYLPLAGLRREAVVFTNTIRCLPTTSGGKLDPKRRADVALLQCCSDTFLYPLIERLRPRVIVPLGAIACRAVCPEVDLELQHGIPVETAWDIPAFPMFHPALGIHEPKRMLLIRTDWQRLKLYLRGALPKATDDIDPDYQEVTDVRDISIECGKPTACDTESQRGGAPFCLTYSQHPGVGRLIRSHRADLLHHLWELLDQSQAPILFHNWLYDWPVTEKMGLQFEPRRIVDTMQQVFHLGNLPQGLKALAYRELGMVMQDFDDLVTPYSTKNVLHYYFMASGLTWPKPEEELAQDDKTGLWKLYRPQSMNTKLKRFFTDYKKNEEKDVFGIWDRWTSAHPALEAELGPWPGKCISHVPFAKVLYYACRDADALIRLWPVLCAMQARVRRFNQEEWRQYA